MSDILLATKIHIPPLHGNLVSRTHLIQRLNDGIAHNRRLTLISAPAGYGKSTLLSEWVSQIGISVAWLSLEKEEDTPARFWSYFITALQTIPHLRQVGIGEFLLQALQSPRLPPMNVLLANLVNELSKLERRVILVLDDLHAVTDDHIHQDLVFLLDHLPLSASGLHLVVAGRMDPPWPLARWRVRDELTEVRAKDLRFTPQEEAAFLNNVIDLNLTSGEIALLDQRTEGWIAGLQMAALSMESRGDVRGFLEGFSGSHRFVLDYLIEEVLSQQKPEILNFLLKTSILEQLTAPLCDNVTGGNDSQAKLIQLEKSNMFLVPLDDERCWYRYHHLFAEMLQVRLKLTHPETISELHARACSWYKDNGFLSKALMHAMTAGDLERLGKLVEEYAFTIFGLDEASAFLSWLNTLPDSVMDPSPWLNIARAWLLAYLGQIDGIEQAILKAEKHADKENNRLWGYIAAMRTLLAEFTSEPSIGILQAHRAFDLLPQGEHRPRAFVSYHLGNILTWQGNNLPALKVLEEALTLSLATGDLELALSAQFERASILHVMGRLAESLRTFENAFQMADSSYPDKKTGSLSVGYAYTQLSILYLEWNDLSEALRQVRVGMQILRFWGYADYLYNGLGHLAKVLLANGELDEALHSIKEAIWIICDPEQPLGRMRALEAGINLARGDLESVSAWAKGTGLSSNDTPVFEHRREFYYFAVFLMAEGKLHEAYRIFERLRVIMEQAGAVTFLLEILAQQTIILHELNEEEQALSILQRALGLAEPEGYIWVFISLGEPMKQMLQKAAKTGSYPNYTSRLLENFKTTDTTPMVGNPPASKISKKNACSSWIEPLSDQELKVLRLLNTHLSVPEIARELYVAPTTVRTHVRNIYGKFGVHGRIEALQRAKELELL